MAIHEAPSTIGDAITLVGKSSKILVFTGAGISTSCGIPDFRSPDGLYSFVGKKYDLPYPEAIFDIEYFRTNPEPFFLLSQEFFSASVRPSRTHEFIAGLENRGKIALVATQNIDMLHQKAGSKKVLECHGTYSSAHCMTCKKPFSLGEFEAHMKKAIPRCTCSGVIKPDIVFFGEALPDEFYRMYRNPPEADLLLVLGTSLNVRPAADFALRYLRNCPSIIVNRDGTGYDGQFTYSYHCDLDEFSEAVWKGLDS